MFVVFNIVLPLYVIRDGTSFTRRWIAGIVGKEKEKECMVMFSFVWDPFVPDCGSLVLWQSCSFGVADCVLVSVLKGYERGGNMKGFVREKDGMRDFKCLVVAFH